MAITGEQRAKLKYVKTLEKNMNENFTILVSVFRYISEQQLFRAPFRETYFTVFIKIQLKSFCIHSANSCTKTRNFLYAFLKNYNLKNIKNPVRLKT